jgi:hypothetical protein
MGYYLAPLRGLLSARKVRRPCSIEEALLYTEDLNHGQEILGVRIRNPFLSLPAPRLR